MLDALLAARTCRIATVGRRSGAPHVVSVWFALVGTTLVAPCRHGEASDWLQNAVAAPTVAVAAGRGRSAVTGRAHLVVEPAERRRAVEALVAKYRSSGSFVAGWLDDPPTLVAIELDA